MIEKPGPEISQKTIAHMMGLFEHLGCYNPTHTTTLLEHQPIITADGLRRVLYAASFDNRVLDVFDLLGWNFNTILPQLKDGSFIFNFNFPGPAPEYPYQYYLIGLANALVCIYRDLGLGSMPKFLAFEQSLKSDGFVSNGKRLIEAETSIIDVPEELSLLERAVLRSRHDSKNTLMHHFNTARQEYDESHWGLSMAEWRNFFEEVVRGAWRFTQQKNPVASTRISKPPMADVLKWLLEFGFFTQDEKDAYGSAWGFLSAGNHPGIKDSDLARFSLTLSMTFGHACLEKLESWTGYSFGKQP